MPVYICGDCGQDNDLKHKEKIKYVLATVFSLHSSDAVSVDTESCTRRGPTLLYSTKPGEEAIYAYLITYNKDRFIPYCISQVQWEVVRDFSSRTDASKKVEVLSLHRPKVQHVSLILSQ
jgi:hypothetical protein